MQDANYTPKVTERPRIVLKVGVTNHHDLERAVDGTISHQRLGRTIGDTLVRIASVARGLCKVDTSACHAGGEAQMRAVSALARGLSRCHLARRHSRHRERRGRFRHFLLGGRGAGGRALGIDLPEREITRCWRIDDPNIIRPPYEMNQEASKRDYDLNPLLP